MAPGPSKFEAPKVCKDVHVGNFQKLAERVEETLEKKALHPAPKQLSPDLLYVSPNNRLGAPPNTHHIHHGVLKSIKEKAFDRTRPAVGICVEIRSEAGKKKVLEHNRKFTRGNKLLPAVPADLASANYHHYRLAGGPTNGSAGKTGQYIARQHKARQSGPPRAPSLVAFLPAPYTPMSVRLLADL